MVWAGEVRAEKLVQTKASDGHPSLINFLSAAYTPFSGRHFHWNHAGPGNAFLYLHFLRSGTSLRPRMREVTVMSDTTIVVLNLTVVTLIYLVITLLFPEKF